MARDLERLNAIRQMLVRERLDAVACAQPRHVLMLSGYWPALGSAWAVATRENEVVLVVPEDERDLAERGWADEIVTFQPASLERIQSTVRAVREPLRHVLARLDAGTLGFEMLGSLEPATYVSTFSYGASATAILADCAPRVRLLPVDHALERLRVKKTSGELARMRATCTLTAKAYDEALRAIHDGATEREVAAALEAAFGAAVPADSRGRAYAYCMAGPDSAEAYRTYQRSRARPIRSGEAVLVHCNAVLDGFWTDVTRTYVLGHDDALARRQQAIATAREAALAAIRPGVAARDVDAAARHAMESMGLEHEIRTPIGHGVGFVAIDHDEPPRLHPHSTDVLEAGMTCNVEPGLYRDGAFGLRHCDMVAVGAERAELLTPFHDVLDRFELAA